ncbi:MAG: sulfotransferase domain-containing protein [Polyangiales bacterium]
MSTRDALDSSLRTVFHPMTSRWLEAYAPWRLARNRRTDVFLLWFPKTGGTWVRLLLHDVLVKHFDVKNAPPLELEPLHDLDARIPRLRPFHDDAPHWKRPEQLRPHKERYRGKKVVLLVRDPRDTIVSLHLQVTKRWKVSPKTTLDEFVWQKRGSFETYLRFYNLWAEHRDVPSELLMLRYEDIHADPHGKLRQLVDFVGVEGVTDQLIADSVEHNRIESLRKREAAGQYQTSRLRPGDTSDPESFKARRGKVGGFVDYLRPEDIAEMTRRTREELDPWYGYTNLE